MFHNIRQNLDLQSSYSLEPEQRQQIFTRKGYETRHNFFQGRLVLDLWKVGSKTNVLVLGRHSDRVLEPVTAQDMLLHNIKKRSLGVTGLTVRPFTQTRVVESQCASSKMKKALEGSGLCPTL